MRSVLLLAFVFTLPTAAATAAVHGDLEVLGSATLSGAVTFGSGHGVLEFARGVASPATLEWAGADGYLLTRTRESVALGPVATGLGVMPPHNASLAFGPARVTAIECQPGCTVIVFPLEGGEVGVSGEAVGRLERLAEPRRFQAFVDAPAPDNFFYEAAAGWIESSPEAAGLRISGSARGAGPLGLFVRDAVVRLETASGPVVVDATDSARTRDVLGVSTGSTHELRALVLLAREATLTADSWTAFVSPAPRVVIDGSLEATNASGRLIVDDELRLLDDALVRVDGRLSVFLGADGRGSSPASLGTAAAPLGAQVEGEARAVFVGAQRISAARAPTDAVVIVSLAALVVAAAFAIANLALPLYTRIDESTVLKNPNRRRVYELIRRKPAIATSEVARELAMSDVVVRHHLHMLKRNALIVTRRHGRRIAHFPGGQAISERASRALLVLKDPTRERVARAVAASPQPASQSELSLRMDVSQRLVSHHLRHLEIAGLVETVGTMPKRYWASAELTVALSAVGCRAPPPAPLPPAASAAPLAVPHRPRVPPPARAAWVIGEAQILTAGGRGKVRPVLAEPALASPPLVPETDFHS